MLELQNLIVRYPDFRCQYDLVVPEGELCVLVGPSGGGKTTLINAIAGFGVTPVGEMRFSGQDLLPLAPPERPVSILFQEHNLFPHLTAADNVGLGLDPGLRLSTLQKGRVTEALTDVGLKGMGTRLPAQLSGGQRQRVALARVLVRNRPLVLLDEPFSGLDPELRRDMIGLVDDMRKNARMTVLLSLHTPEDAASKADRIVTIAQGRIESVATSAKTRA